MVKEDFSCRFGKMLVHSWVRMVEAHANDTNENNQNSEKAGEIVKLYGTTLSVALVFNGRLFSGRIGDSSVFAVMKQHKKQEVKNLFESDQAEAPGLGTASLCSKDAYRKWQIQALPLDDILLLLLATDGFADSLQDPKGEIAEYYRYINKKGSGNFERIIDEELNQLSGKGVGDDISLVIFLPD
jgi:serine/threonine protein phosphatase PrpC